MRMMKLALGLATGYVLGARAGREKYDQIVTKVGEFRGQPAVAEAEQAGKDLLSTGDSTTSPAGGTTSATGGTKGSATDSTPADTAWFSTPAETPVAEAEVDVVAVVIPADVTPAADDFADVTPARDTAPAADVAADVSSTKVPTPADVFVADVTPATDTTPAADMSSTKVPTPADVFVADVTPADDTTPAGDATSAKGAKPAPTPRPPRKRTKSTLTAPSVTGDTSPSADSQ